MKKQLDYTSTDKVIRDWGRGFQNDINKRRREMGVKHKRKLPPVNNKVKYKKVGGRISIISTSMTMGDMMTQKGAGKNPLLRVPKPYHTASADDNLPALSDAVAKETGNTICEAIIRL